MIRGDYLPFERGIRDGLRICLRRLSVFMAVVLAAALMCGMVIIWLGFLSRAAEHSPSGGRALHSIATTFIGVAATVTLRKMLSSHSPCGASHNGIYVGTAYVSVLLLGAMALLMLSGLSFMAHKEQTPFSYCAPSGDHIRIALDDGSRLQLNSGTCVSSMFSSTDRLVRLDSGEALFEVAHDPNRPFIVEAGLISIEALGTQFDVYRRSVSTRVTVIDGAVQISSKGTTLSSSAKPLTVLQQLDVPDDIAQARVRRNLTPGDLERMAAWTHGDMVLEIQTPTEMREGVAR